MIKRVVSPAIGYHYALWQILILLSQCCPIQKIVTVPDDQDVIINILDMGGALVIEPDTCYKIK